MLNKSLHTWDLTETKLFNFLANYYILNKLGLILMYLYNIMDAMKTKPGFFGIDSVKSIFYFIQGYKNAVSEHNIADDDLAHFELGFLEWVKKCYPNSPSHANWDGLVTLYSTYGPDSVDLFFSLLDKYRLSTGRELTDPQSRFQKPSMSDMPL